MQASLYEQTRLYLRAAVNICAGFSQTLLYKVCPVTGIMMVLHGVTFAYAVQIPEMSSHWKSVE